MPSRTSAVGCEKTGRQEADIANKRDVAGAIYCQTFIKSALV